MATENEIFTSQVRDANNNTLDIILANLTAQTAVSNAAANSVEVSANGGSTLFAKSLNFVNTANITVVVTDKGDGNANVAFFGSTSSPAGPNGAIEFANNGTFGGTSNLTYNIATNTLNANGTVNVAGLLTLNGLNVSGTLANAYNKANGSAIYANGTIVVANTANLNFNNTATVNVSLSANGNQTNIAFSINTAAVTANAGAIIDYSATATTNQSSFTMSANATAAAYVIVTINGLLQIPGIDYSIANNNLTFTSNCSVNDIIDARIFSTGSSVIGAGIPGGANTWVQFNDAGQFGGSANLSYNKNTNTLNVGGANSVLIVNGANVMNLIANVYALANLGANTTSVSANNSNPLAARQLNFNNTISTQVTVQDVGNGNANIAFLSQVALVIPMSPLLGNLSTGTAVAYLRSPKSFTLTNVTASVFNSSTSGNVAVQIRQNGTNILAIPVTINPNSNTSLVASQQPTFANANTTVGLNDLLLFDITQAGTNASGLMVTLLGNG